MLRVECNFVRIVVNQKLGMIEIKFFEFYSWYFISGQKSLEVERSF